MGNDKAMNDIGNRFSIFFNTRKYVEKIYYLKVSKFVYAISLMFIVLFLIFIFIDEDKVAKVSTDESYISEYLILISIIISFFINFLIDKKTAVKRVFFFFSYSFLFYWVAFLFINFLWIAVDIIFFKIFGYRIKKETSDSLIDWISFAYAIILYFKCFFEVYLIKNQEKKTVL